MSLPRASIHRKQTDLQATVSDQTKSTSPSNFGVDQWTVSRRTVLKSSAMAVVSGSAASAEVRAERQIVDTNVSLFDWPFRQLPLHDTATLVKHLMSLGIREAWASSFEAILHRDLASVNRRLVEECSKYDVLTPIGSINPALAGWQTDLEFCAQHPDVNAVRLLPGYHGYDLASSDFQDLIVATAQKNLSVQICVSLEDVRTQPALVKVSDVELSPLLQSERPLPRSHIQLLNVKPTALIVSQLAACPEVRLDTARFDGTDGVPAAVRMLQADQILFGSHAPFLIPEAALIRIFESQQLTAMQVNRLLQQNARQWRNDSQRQAAAE